MINSSRGTTAFSRAIGIAQAFDVEDVLMVHRNDHPSVLLELEEQTTLPT
jgi:hypothetical protein